MSDLEARLRAIVSTGALPSPDVSAPHMHGKPTDPRDTAGPRQPVVTINTHTWPDCEFCAIGHGHQPATVSANIGAGPDRYLCDHCYETFAFGNVKRQLIPGLGHLVKPTNSRLR